MPVVGRDRLAEVLEEASASAQVLGFRTMKHNAQACALESQCCAHKGCENCWLLNSR